MSSFWICSPFKVLPAMSLGRENLLPALLPTWRERVTKKNLIFMSEVEIYKKKRKHAFNQQKKLSFKKKTR